MTAPALTEYRVHIAEVNPNTGERMYGFIVRVAVADRAEAPAEALRKTLRLAHEANARQGREIRSESSEDYTVEKVRKAPRWSGRDRPAGPGERDLDLPPGLDFLGITR